MSSSWWSQKLGGNAPQPSQSTPVPPMPSRAVPPMQQPAPRQQNIQVTGENVADAAMTWQGGEGTRRETSNCPNCGSNLYFSRANSGTTVSVSGMATPAPRCYSCGYTDGRQMQGLPT